MKLIRHLDNYHCTLKWKSNKKKYYFIAASRHCSATSSKMQIAILLSSGVLSLPCIQNNRLNIKTMKNKCFSSSKKSRFKNSPQAQILYESAWRMRLDHETQQKLQHSLFN